MESQEVSSINEVQFETSITQHALCVDGLAVNDEPSSNQAINYNEVTSVETKHIARIDMQTETELSVEPLCDLAVDFAGPQLDVQTDEQSKATDVKENDINMQHLLVSLEGCDKNYKSDSQGESKSERQCIVNEDYQSKELQARPDENHSDAYNQIASKSADLNVTVTGDKLSRKHHNSCHKEVDERTESPSVCQCPVSRGNKYKCGGCASRFQTICELHQHLKLHGSRGSYHYDEITFTAFPKFDSVCKSSQTKIDVQNVVIAKPVLKALISTAKTQISQSKTDQKVSRKRKQSPANGAVVDKKTKTKLSNMLKVKEPKKRGRKPKIKPNSESISEEIKVSRFPRQAKRVKNKRYTVEVKQEIEQNAAIENVDVIEDRDVHVVEEISAKKQEGQVSDDSLTEIPDITNQVENDSKEKVHSNGITNNVETLPHRDELCGGNQEEMNTEIVGIKDEDITKKENEEKLKVKSLKTAGKKLKGPRHAEKTAGDLYMSCEVCNTVVLQKKYKEHLVSHSDKKLFICEVCGMGYAKKSNLSRHSMTHSDVKPFQCKLCPSQFIRKMDYECHVNSHKGYRPHVCKVCDKSFLTSKGLKAHQENIHMGFTKFQCGHCDRRFFKRSGLNTHEATHYEATLKCQYCDHKFRDKCGLRKHERTHTGLKHYQCHVCNSAFNQCTPFYVHMEKRHDIDRESIKQVMKVVMEAYKRVGKKLEFYRVPNNIEEIMANLQLQEEKKLEQGAKESSSGANSKPSCLTRISPSTIANVIRGGKPVNEVINSSPENSNQLNQSNFALSDLSQKYDLRVCVNKGVESKSYDEHHVAMSVVEEFSPMNSSSIPPMPKEESGTSLLDLDKQPKTWISTDGQIVVVSADLQGYQESGTLAQSTAESHRSRQYTSAHRKSKIKFLSQNSEFHMQRPPVQAVNDQAHEEKRGMVSHMSNYPVHGHAGQQMDPVIEAYTADFLEKIFQSQ